MCYHKPMELNEILPSLLTNFVKIPNVHTLASFLFVSMTRSLQYELRFGWAQDCTRTVYLLLSHAYTQSAAICFTVTQHMAEWISEFWLFMFYLSLVQVKSTYFVACMCVCGLFQSLQWLVFWFCFYQFHKYFNFSLESSSLWLFFFKSVDSTFFLFIPQNSVPL